MFHQPLNTALEIATPRDTARAFVNGIEKNFFFQIKFIT